jgi:hypothetical protein
MVKPGDSQKKKAAGILIIAAGAVLLAEGIIKWMGGTSFLFPWLNFVLEFIIGFFVIVLGEILLVRKAR